MKKTKTKNLVMISIYIALCVGLDIVKELIPFINMPSGGSINIALIPLTICSFHLGIKKGMITGLLWLIVSSILGLNNYYISIPQIIFDYVIPSVIVGASSIFYKKKNLLEIEFGIFLTMLIRTLSITYSGAVFWYNGTLAAWIDSCAYNLPYSIATLIVLMISTPLLLKTLKKYLV